MSGKGGEVPEGKEGEAEGGVSLTDQQSFKRGERKAPRQEGNSEKN